MAGAGGSDGGTRESAAKLANVLKGVWDVDSTPALVDGTLGVGHVLTLDADVDRDVFKSLQHFLQCVAEKGLPKVPFDDGDRDKHTIAFLRLHALCARMIQ